MRPAKEAILKRVKVVPQPTKTVFYRLKDSGHPLTVPERWLPKVVIGLAPIQV